VVTWWKHNFVLKIYTVLGVKWEIWKLVFQITQVLWSKALKINTKIVEKFNHATRQFNAVSHGLQIKVGDW